MKDEEETRGHGDGVTRGHLPQRVSVSARLRVPASSS
jgi:hypothetical protein